MKGNILNKVVFERENAPKWTFLYLVDSQRYIELPIWMRRQNDTFGVHKYGILTFLVWHLRLTNASFTHYECRIRADRCRPRIVKFIFPLLMRDDIMGL